MMFIDLQIQFCSFNHNSWCKKNAISGLIYNILDEQNVLRCKSKQFANNSTIHSQGFDIIHRYVSQSTHIT